MINYITPNDKDAMGNSDSESIQNAIKIAAESGTRKVLIPRLNQRTGKSVWDIEKAIILTSDIEIILDNCLLRQADGVLTTSSEVTAPQRKHRKRRRRFTTFASSVKARQSLMAVYTTELPSSVT